MLRTRDFCAVLAILWLSRMAWRDPAESLSANAFLSWYIPHNHLEAGEVQAWPSLLDVDGDQKPETIVMIVPRNNQWVLQVSDLKPSGSTDKTHLAPFKPKVLYESQPIVLEGEATSKPLALTTGHVNMMFEPKKSKPADTDGSDRTRHYFCGVDWHDASEKCTTPCSKGQADECPEGERCYADTPCDSHSSSTKSALDDADVHFTTTGSIPSIFVMWGSGSVTMHSLTAPKGSSRKLQLEQQWTMTSSKDLNRTMESWDDASMDFVDSIDSDSPGMVILTGYVDYKHHGDDEEISATMTAAIDAKTGSVVWDSYHLDDDETPETESPVLPIGRGLTSGARRRSRIPSLEEGHQSTGARTNVNCLHAYRRSLLTSDALPYMYVSRDDAGINLAHFTHHEKPKKVKGKERTWKRKKVHRRKTHLGKPNVVISRNFRGIHVRSLRNGKSVCHLSLWDNSLYADLNHDGVLDAVQTVTGHHGLPSSENESHNDDDEYAFYNALLKRVGNMNDQESRKEMEAGSETTDMHMCHLMALSGVPNKEELYSVNMCERRRGMDEDELPPSTSMAVEAAKGKGFDVVVPLGDGRIARYRGNTGRRMWHLNGARYEDFPEWEELDTVGLARVESPNTVPATRPILLSGEKSLALISPGSGVVLTTSSYPAPVIRKPLLVDFNADGTTDVIIATADAIWGYRVSVKTGASIFFRILVGLLMGGMMLALLRNRFGPTPGKRSTDL